MSGSIQSLNSTNQSTEKIETTSSGVRYTDLPKLYEENFQFLSHGYYVKMLFKARKEGYETDYPTLEMKQRVIEELGKLKSKESLHFEGIGLIYKMFQAELGDPLSRQILKEYYSQQNTNSDLRSIAARLDPSQEIILEKSNELQIGSEKESSMQQSQAFSGILEPQRPKKRKIPDSSNNEHIPKIVKTSSGVRYTDFVALVEEAIEKQNSYSFTCLFEKLLKKREEGYEVAYPSEARRKKIIEKLRDDYSGNCPETALALTMCKAELGDLLSQKMVERFYEEKAPREDIFLIQGKVRAEEGDTEQMMKVFGHYEANEDPKSALPWLIKAAEFGNLEAQNFLAIKYREGNGVEVSDEKAFYWFEKSARQHYFDSFIDVAICYETGVGTDKNVTKAIEYYKTLAEPLMGLDIHEDDTRDACYRLGYLYQQGIEVEKNDTMAVKYFIQGSRWRSPNCMFSLALCELEGRGIDKNVTNGLARLEYLATEVDDIDAQYFLGALLYRGNELNYIGENEIHLDPKKAVFYLEKAANKGYASAMRELGRILLEGAEGVEMNPEAGNYWCQKGEEAREE